MSNTNQERLFSQAEKYQAPSSVLFRSIELKLLKERFWLYLKLRPGLDLGCGDGLAAEIVFEGKLDFGLDNNPQSATSAEKRGLYSKVLVASAEHIPLESESLKLVFANCVVEHIKNLDAVMKETARVLAPGGIFILTAPSAYFKSYSLFGSIKLNYLSKFYGWLRDKKLAHFNCLPLEEWKAILKRHDLEIIESYEYIDKKTLEWWDLLLILNPAFMILRKLNYAFTAWLYQKFFRPSIYKRYLEASFLANKGAALGLAARKNSHA